MQDDKSKGRRPWKPKSKLLLGIGVCAILIISSWLLGQRYAPVRSILNTLTQPIQSAYKSIENWFEEKSEDLKSKESLQKENAALKEELARLQKENLKLQSDARRVQELEDLYPDKKTKEREQLIKTADLKVDDVIKLENKEK